MITINHYIKVGEVISSMGEQVAIADSHEVWQPDKANIHIGEYITAGEATIRISSGCENVINTNWMNDKGVVCFLPVEFKRCAILKVKITKVFNKSVKAIPIDYIKSDKPLDWLCHGMEAKQLLEETAEYPNIHRVVA